MAEDADNLYFKNLSGMVPAHFNLREEDEEADAEEQTEWQSEPVPKKKKKQQKSGSGSQQGDTVSARDEKIQGKKDSKQKKKKSKDKGDSKVSVQEAQVKLRARIAELQAKRVQNLTGVETQERKRLERKQRRLNVKKPKNKKKGGADPKENGVEVTEPVVVEKATKPIRTEEGKLVFSKFDLTQSGEKDKKSDLVGKDFKRILARLEQRETKVAKLKEKDADAATSLEQKFIWQDVMAKAKGEKIKDDVTKVKKAVQRKEKTKEKRKKKWGDRTATEEKYINQRQEKRTENIQKRKDDKKAKHRKKMIKKGRILPGF